MAQVTIELRHLLENTNFKLFDFDYTVDDPLFKRDLEEHITAFFYDYEIGQETPKMFKRKFNARFTRIIGFYNELYNTTLLEYNPLVNYSMNEAMEQLASATGKTIAENTTNTNQTGEQTSDIKMSDYPQQSIAGGDYLSGENLTKQNDISNGSAVNNASSSNNDISESTYSKTIEGITGTSYQELISKQRSLIINIYDMIINELKPCFILVF